MIDITEKENVFFDTESEDDDYFGTLPENFNFTPSKSTPNIASLVLSYQNGLLKIPDFQREFVWDKKQASTFIESLLLNLPIPNLFFYCDKEFNNYIIDGQQRLKSVFCFLGALDKETISKQETDFLNFQLTGLSPQSPWYNKTFNMLSETDKRKLQSRTLDIVTITVNNDNDLKGVYHIFKRLNTGGTKLTEQEIRNCVYAGKFNNFLHELNNNKNWQKLITLDKKQGRLKDVELILRFFALYDDLLSYRTPMKEFLSDYMRKKSNISDEEIQIKQELFKATIESIYKCLGENPFHTKNQINSSVCDSIMVGFAKNLNNIPEDIEERYANLTKYNSDYETYTSNSSNTKKYVYKRIQMAETHLFPPKKLMQNNGESSKHLKIYPFSISGVKNFDLEKNFKYIDFSGEQIESTFAIKVQGNEMSPLINNGDILLVNKTNKPKNGDIIIAKFRDVTMCRRVLYSNKNIFLKINNATRNQIKITQETYDDFKCYGVVTKIINGNTIK